MRPQAPLTRFLLGGALLFVLHGIVAGNRHEGPDDVVVSEARIADLAATFERLWQRSPTDGELQTLIDEDVREEILYREALALGLDRDDPVVRRRLRQKMEFLSEDLFAPPTASNQDLQDHLDAHADDFRVPPRTSFEQIFVDPLGSENDVRQRAAGFLDRARSEEEPARGPLGDPSLLPRSMTDAMDPEIDDRFGKGFTEAIAALPEGEWSGPVTSSFGFHLVRVTKRTPERVPPVEEIRTAVEREWNTKQRRAANERTYQALRARYRVTIRKPGTALTER